MSINLYATTKENVTYVTEQDVYKVGSMMLNMSDITGGLGRQVKVELHLGRTEFKLDAKDMTTGTVVAATYDFLTQ